MTRRVGLIGKPLKRRHSQVMHDAAFDAAGIDARYVLLELDEDAVADAVREARGPDWLGLGVTAPYKRLVAGSCDEVEPDADTIGAVNNVVRRDDGSLLGFNSDAPGFRAGVELAMGRSLDGAAVVVAGAGGAAHAVVFACLRAGAREVIVGNRTAGSATALVQRFAGVGRGARSAVALDDPAFAAALGSADLAVNATTVGMLDPGATIAGRAAAARGDRVRPGLRPGRDAPPPGGSRAWSASGEWLGDADRPGRHRVRALDRRGRHGRRHARGGRAVAGRRLGPGLTVRLATIVEGGRPLAAVVVDDRCLPVATGDPELDPSVRAIAASGTDGLARLRDWADRQPAAAYRSVADVELGPAVADPGAIYTVGLNYRTPGETGADVGRPVRPLVYGKAASAVAGPGGADLGPGAGSNGGSRVRARRGHRCGRRRRRRVGRHEPCLRVHLHQRRLVA